MSADLWTYALGAMMILSQKKGRITTVRKVTSWLLCLVQLSGCATLISRGELPSNATLPEVKEPKRPVSLRVYHIEKYESRADGQDIGIAVWPDLKLQDAVKKVFEESGYFSSVTLLSGSMQTETALKGSVDEVLQHLNDSSPSPKTDLVVTIRYSTLPPYQEGFYVIPWMVVSGISLGLVPFAAHYHVSFYGTVETKTFPGSREFNATNTANSWYSSLFLPFSASKLSRSNVFLDSTEFYSNTVKALLEKMATQGALK